MPPQSCKSTETKNSHLQRCPRHTAPHHLPQSPPRCLKYSRPVMTRPRHPPTCTTTAAPRMTTPCEAFHHWPRRRGCRCRPPLAMKAHHPQSQGSSRAPLCFGRLPRYPCGNLSRPCQSASRQAPPASWLSNQKTTQWSPTWTRRPSGLHRCPHTPHHLAQPRGMTEWRPCPSHLTSTSPTHPTE